MSTKKIKRENRKRKLQTPETEEFEYNVPSCKNRVFDIKAEKEEENLSKDLFGDNLGFLESLEDVELFPSSSANVDSGIGETEHDEDEMSNDESDRKPAWHDDEDDGIDVGSALNVQGRNIVEGGVNEKTAKYSNLLKHKFASYHKSPKWASLNKTTDENDSDEELLQTTGHLVKVESVSLTPTVLEYKKLRDLNSETYSEGPLITSVEFHPTSTVALVAGISGILSLFAVDGKRNNKLHSVSFDKYPIECTKYLNDGTEVLIGSRHAHFFSYDLMAAKANRVPLPHGITQCKKFEVSPCKKYIALAGKWGEVHLLSAGSKELITTLKQNSEVTDLTFNTSGSLLFGHSVDGEVTVWDMTSHRVKHKWNDEGCIKGTKLCVSPSGQLIATGSAQGVVNLYDIDTVLQHQNPKPRKTVLNLTTSISNLQFNSTSEMLGLASSELSNAVRLLHISSGKIFNNFPQWGTKLGRINYLSFSPNSGYAAFGNRKSTVFLYRLKHFNNY